MRGGRERDGGAARRDGDQREAAARHRLEAAHRRVACGGRCRAVDTHLPRRHVPGGGEGGGGAVRGARVRVWRGVVGEGVGTARGSRAGATHIVHPRQRSLLDGIEHRQVVCEEQRLGRVCARGGERPDVLDERGQLGNTRLLEGTQQQLAPRLAATAAAASAAAASAAGCAAPTWLLEQLLQPPDVRVGRLARQHHHLAHLWRQIGEHFRLGAPQRDRREEDRVQLGEVGRAARVEAEAMQRREEDASAGAGAARARVGMCTHGPCRDRGLASVAVCKLSHARAAPAKGARQRTRRSRKAPWWAYRVRRASQKRCAKLVQLPKTDGARTEHCV